MKPDLFWEGAFDYSFRFPACVININNRPATTIIQNLISVGGLIVIFKLVSIALTVYHQNKFESKIKKAEDDAFS